jgi:hypothetical protein
MVAAVVAVSRWRQEVERMNTFLMPLCHLGCSSGPYELRFQSLFTQGRALAFPCDATGHVDLDALSERAMENYLYARTLVGREYATPLVVNSAPH